MFIDNMAIIAFSMYRMIYPYICHSSKGTEEKEMVMRKMKGIMG